MYRPLFFALTCIGLVSAARLPSIELPSQIELSTHKKPDGSCFPALGFKMPPEVPPDSEFSSWWCDPADKYAFVGFSYEVTACRCLVFLPVSLVLSGFIRPEQITAYL